MLFRSGEVIEGIVLDSFEDKRAKEWKDNNSRWISSRMLVDGRPRIVDIYWDDEYEILSRRGPGRPTELERDQ